MRLMLLMLLIMLMLMQNGLVVSSEVGLLLAQAEGAQRFWALSLAIVMVLKFHNNALLLVILGKLYVLDGLYCYCSVV